MGYANEIFFQIYIFVLDIKANIVDKFKIYELESI